MKVAIHNPFAGQLVAETELSRRIHLAATNLGWDAIEAHTAPEINACQPDFVIALHNNSPKLTQYPTYGCMWNPPSFFEGTDPFVRHVLTYDGYLTSSPVLDRWLHHILHTTPKPVLTAPFYTSCPATPYQPPQLDPPRLMYIGSNWDGARFKDLFAELDTQPYLEVYGRPEGWQHLTQSYRGSLPYDGHSVLNTLRQAGVGLCLHRAEHRAAGLPSMRIFEIVASGAIALCSDHPFIRQSFGDSVLYINPDQPIAQQIQQISDHLTWIQANPQIALAMSQQSHQIFLKHYALEHLLEAIVPYHQHILQQKGFTRPLRTPSTHIPSVQFLLHLTPESPDSDPLPNLLDQIAHQTHPNIGLILIKPADLDLPELPHQDKFPITILDCPPSPPSEPQDSARYTSTSLWAGLNAIDADYFALLDPSGTLYPNHIHSLLSLLETHPEAGVAYAGTLRTFPESAAAQHPELAELAEFDPTFLDRTLQLNPPFPPHGFLARRALLDPILLQDPQLNHHETLCLILHLLQRTRFLFSYEVTCETRQPAIDPATRLNEFHNWSSELSRLKFIFWNQEFAPGKTLQSIHSPTHSPTPLSDSESLKATLEQYRAEMKQLHKKYKTETQRFQAEWQQSQEQLQQARDRISAMETSKFWQLRSAWFRVKQRLGVRSEE
ncbi:glycosyltransferase family protein [Egbenema bharatensis]|uniref:glycosyltransferase family protein n=1 Tax=Egbenema bharatensis TaxID=3463334 RepID=UPI003A843124